MPATQQKLFSVISRQVKMIRKLVFITAIFITCNACAANRSSLLQDLNNYLATDQLGNAYTTLTALRSLSPDDSKLAYNAACLASKMSDLDIAIADLENAFELGFDDVHLLASDSDLKPLHSNLQFINLVAQIETELADRATEKAIAITSGSSSKKLSLSNFGNATISANSTGLSTHLVIPANAFQERAEPWFNGGGVLRVIAVPDSSDSFDSERIWRFGFGKYEGEPAGWVISTPDQMVNTRVKDLTPRLRLDPSAGNALLDINIPWEYLEPYQPPSDTVFGINIHLITTSDDGQKLQLSLLDDPSGNRRQVSKMRYIPMSFGQGNQLQFSGAINNSIIGNKPISLDIKLWSDEAAMGTLFTDVLGPDGVSVVGNKIIPEVISISAGVNSWHREADLSAMPQGLYQLTAGLATQDTILVWSTPVMKYDGSWPFSVYDRSKKIREIDRASVMWRVNLVEQSLATRDLRSNPATTLITLGETEDLLNQGINNGHILPEKGIFAAAFSTPDNKLMPVNCLIPEPDKQERCLIWVTSENVPADALANLLSNRMQAREFPWDKTIVLIPQFRNSADLKTCILWAREMFPEKQIQLFGRDDSAVIVKKVEETYPEAANNYYYTTQPVDSASELIRDVAKWLVSL